jgi:hypothetical protein
MLKLNKIEIVKKSLLVTLGGLAVCGSYITPALAGDYTFNKHIGNIYVGSASVYKNVSNGVSATANVGLPSCGTTSKLQGYVTFSYKANDGGYFNNYKYNVTGQEGANVTAYVNVPQSMSGDGNLVIGDNTWCENVAETRTREVVTPVKDAGTRITNGAKRIRDIFK